MPTQPIDDATLDELAKTQPDLVAQYRAKMQAPNQAVQNARDTQDYGSIANIAAKNLTDYGNAKQNQAVLYNRIQDLGGAPAVKPAYQRGYDDSVISGVTDRGVARAKEDQAVVANQFGEEQKLTDMGRSRDWQDKSQAQTQKSWDVENARNDPNGPQAQQARLLLKSALLSKATEAAEAARQGIPGAQDAVAQLKEQAANAGDGMAAGDIMQQAKLINDTSFDKVLEMRAKKAQIDSTSAYRQSLLDDKAERREAAESTKATAAQAKALAATKAALETARGNPAVAQAEKDIYAADKADSLANMYGDPNKLSSQQVNLLASEVGKIASGGTPSMHELEGLTPNTLVGKLGVIASKLTNEPTPANAAAFVKQYQDYTKALRSDAQKVITDKYGRVIESSKKDIGDDNYGTLKDNYLNRFNKPEASAAGLHGKDLP